MPFCSASRPTHSSTRATGRDRHLPARAPGLGQRVEPVVDDLDLRLRQPDALDAEVAQRVGDRDHACRAPGERTLDVAERPEPEPVVVVLRRDERDARPRRARRRRLRGRGACGRGRAGAAGARGAACHASAGSRSRGQGSRTCSAVELAVEGLGVARRIVETHEHRLDSPLRERREQRQEVPLGAADPADAVDVDDSHATRTRLRLHVETLPELEHHQAPEPVAVVGPAGDVLVQQPLEHGGPELAALPHPLVEEHLGGEPAQPAPEPVADRDAEARLPTARDLGWQRVGERLPERLLAAEAASLQPVGERDAELEHLVVEERRAELERVRHRGDVGLQQQVAGKVGLHVEALQPGHAAARRRAEEAPGGNGVGHELRLPQLGTQRRREHLHQPAVPGLRRRRRHFEQPPGAVRPRPRLGSSRPP